MVKSADGQKQDRLASGIAEMTGYHADHVARNDIKFYAGPYFFPTEV
jgi:hypothetical protein